jgi:hypothetical protein
MSEKGWFSIDREIEHSDLWLDKPFARGQAWIDLLLLANHKTKTIFFDGRLVEVERGSTITSVRKLGERWGWSRHKVSDFLKILSVHERITYEVIHRKYTVIRITKYDEYQSRNITPTKRGHTIHTENTDKQRLSRVIHNEEVTPKGHSSDTEVTLKDINNNDNNVNNDNNTRDGVRVLGSHQHVTLKDFEMKSLLNELGEDKFLKVIRRLDDYIERTGKSYNKPHFLVIKDWVVNAVEEDEKREQAKPKPKNKFNDFPQRTYTREEIDDLELRLLGLKK